MGSQHVLITGGASGLGFGCAQRFAALGFDVTLADIDLAAAQRAAAVLRNLQPGTDRIRVEALDLADPASIAACAQRLMQQGQAIDVLVNNAGIYPPSQRSLSTEGHELTFAIAHLGHFRLTHALWPLLQRADAARVISISSLVQRQARLNLDDLSFERAYEPIRAYQQAKLSCLLFALELQRRLDATGSRVASYAAHPGVCRTQIGRNRRRSPQDRLWQRLAGATMAIGLRHVGQSPQQGAASVIEAATSATLPRGAFVGPRWLMESCGPPVLITPGPAARDAALAARLWSRTEALTGVRGWP